MCVHQFIEYVCTYHSHSFSLKIFWRNRIPDSAPKTNRLISVDGTDFRIPEQSDCPKSWYSFKFRGPGLRYELGLGVFTGKIVWISGPWRAGRFPDITIFRSGGLRGRLITAGEKAVADKGYRGEPDTIDLPDEGSESHQAYKKEARSRHEHCNRRFKQFQCLGQRFRHKIDFHRECFKAVVVLTELSLENGEPLWDIFA